MPKWSIVTLERACRRAFVQGGTLALEAMNDAGAKATWHPGGPVEATIDPLTTSYLGGVIHELTHNVLVRELSPFKDYTTKHGEVKDDLQEITVNAWQAAVEDLIYRDSRRLEWWRRAIDKKLRNQTEKK